MICTHYLASIDSRCDEVALINRTVLTYGSLATTFTPENIAKSYGGVFSHLIFNSDAVKRHRARGATTDGEVTMFELWHSSIDPF